MADEEVEEHNRRKEKSGSKQGVRDERFRHDSTGGEITAPVRTDVYTTASCQRLTNMLALQRQAANTQMGFGVSNVGCLTAAEQANLMRQSAESQ